MKSVGPETNRENTTRYGIRRLARRSSNVVASLPAETGAKSCEISSLPGRTSHVHAAQGVSRCIELSLSAYQGQYNSIADPLFRSVSSIHEVRTASFSTYMDHCPAEVARNAVIMSCSTIAHDNAEGHTPLKPRVHHKSRRGAHKKRLVICCDGTWNNS